MPRIQYFEKDGDLWFSYEEKVRVPTKLHAAVEQVFESSGKIPKKIQKRGEEAIKKYAARRVKEGIKKQKAEAKEWEAFERNPDFPVSVEYEDRILKGRIISAEDYTLVVRLEEPYQGEASVSYGWASAMSGKYIFAGRQRFSEDAIDSAQKLLIDIYKKEQYYEEHKEIVDLAERLNKSPFGPHH